MDTTTFKARYKEFENVADKDIIMHLEECSTLLNASKLGAKYQQLLFLLTAHELHLQANPTNEAGVVASRAIEGGSISIKNIATNERDLYYSKSSYGLKYLALKKSVRFVGAVLCESKLS
jgi:hypothetical protein